MALKQAQAINLDEGQQQERQQAAPEINTLPMQDAVETDALTINQEAQPTPEMAISAAEIIPAITLDIDSLSIDSEAMDDVAEINLAAYDDELESEATQLNIADTGGTGQGEAMAAEGVVKVLAAGLGGAASAFESLFAGTPRPPSQEEKIIQAERAADDREAQIAVAAERIRLANEEYQKQQDRERDQGLDLGRSR